MVQILTKYCPLSVKPRLLPSGELSAKGTLTDDPLCLGLLSFNSTCWAL